MSIYELPNVKELKDPRWLAADKLTKSFKIKRMWTDIWTTKLVLVSNIQNCNI